MSKAKHYTMLTFLIVAIAFFATVVLMQNRTWSNCKNEMASLGNVKTAEYLITYGHPPGGGISETNTLITTDKCKILVNGLYNIPAGASITLRVNAAQQCFVVINDSISIAMNGAPAYEDVFRLMR